MDRTERDRQIAASDAHPDTIAERFGVSRSTVYRVRKEARMKEAQPDNDDYTRVGDLTFGQIARSGVEFHGGAVFEEFQRELRGDGGVKLYTEMSKHPVIAAVLFAIEMAQRQVEWYVEPAGEDEDSKRDAEFLEQCMSDMSQTWDDVVSQVFTMLVYGFSTCELVYKKRLGENPPDYIDDPASSKHDDGLVGWRRWQFISPKSLSSGDWWDFDEAGRVRGINQTPAPDYYPRHVPIEKALLFRTVVRWDNPEGESVLRPMYKPWYFAENLAEVEAIGAERLGVGLPVVYMGTNTKKDGSNSDLAYFEDLVRNVRTDDQMGVVIPYPKMGAGAPEGTGALLELVSPPSRGFIDFNAVIERYEKRMAMVVLAQFIFLGMLKVGTQALNESATDTFQMSISAWSKSVADVINIFAVPRLFKLNGKSTTNLPQIRHSGVGVPDLVGIAEFINKLVGATVLTPDEGLEAHHLSLSLDLL